MDLTTRQGRREQGQRIQQAVERAGLSVEDLAGRIGCSRALIYQYLSGTTLAQPDKLQQIAAECGVPLTYFFESGPDDSQQSPVTEPPPLQVSTRVAESLRALQELADAQEGSPDYSQVASTCERILSLAAQLGDRRAVARAQYRLGRARLVTADYPRAADALARAVTLAQEAADSDSEVSARQSLGAALLAMGRDEEARQQFALVAASPSFQGRWRGTLSLGGLDEMHGDYHRAMERFDETAAILEDGEARGVASSREVAVGQMYVMTNRTNVYLDGGDFAGARPLAEKCAADAESLGIAEQHLEARFNLAWCDLQTGQWEGAYRGLSTMLQLARFVGEQGRENMARAWIGIFYAAAGDTDTAAEYGKDALAVALSRGDRRGELYAQLALADAYTAAGNRESEARYHAIQAIAVTTALRQERGEIECRLRLARLSAQHGDAAELSDAISRALSGALRLGARHLESLARCWAAAAVCLHIDRGQIDGDRAGALATARQEAAAALDIAADIGLTEGRWRAEAVMGTIAVLESDSARAIHHLHKAVEALEGLRVQLRSTGLPDTLLENDDCAAIYLQLARLMRDAGQTDELTAFLDATGWPPLTARIGEVAAQDA